VPGDRAVPAENGFVGGRAVPPKSVAREMSLDQGRLQYVVDASAVENPSRDDPPQQRLQTSQERPQPAVVSVEVSLHRDRELRVGRAVRRLHGTHRSRVHAKWNRQVWHDFAATRCTRIRHRRPTTRRV
jgi:hypothetical protein